MNIANKLTFLRVILVFVFMVVIWIPFIPLLNSLWLALVIFVIASITDFFDGYLARKLNLITNLGKFMDPLADKILVTAAMIAIVDIGAELPAGILPAWIVVIILIREFAVSGIRLLAASIQVVIAASYLGKIKTVIQMAMIIVYLIPIRNSILQLLASILSFAALAMTIISGAEYIWKNRKLLSQN